MTPEQALAKAIQAAGGTVKVAKACEVTPQAVSQWRICPSRHVYKVAALSEGLIAAAALRPDMFGAAA